MRLEMCIFLLRWASLKLTGTDLLVTATFAVLVVALVTFVEELALVDVVFLTVELALLEPEYSPAGQRASASWGIFKLGIFQDSSAN
jgi:hypothetical protein